MGSKEFFRKHWLARNLFRGAVFILVVCISVRVASLILTKHHAEIEVPDFTAMDRDQVSLASSLAGVRPVIVDSVYIDRMKRGVVYSQNPAPGARVKKGRKVYLTYNARSAKKVRVPNVVGCSMRQAKAEILSAGLAIGQYIYIEDMATNNVLGQLSAGQTIEPGSMVDAGTRIDLQLGLNPEDGRTFVPQLSTLGYSAALNAIQDNSLNVRRVVFDETVLTYADSLEAFVFRQDPAYSEEFPVRMGTAVSIFLTLDRGKLPKPEEPLDSLNVF